MLNNCFSCLLNDMFIILPYKCNRHANPFLPAASKCSGCGPGYNSPLEAMKGQCNTIADTVVITGNMYKLKHAT